jgi:hypothetical protein
MAPMAEKQNAGTDPNELVAAYVTNDLTEAEIVKAALLAEGIKAEVDSQTQGGLVEVLDVRVVVGRKDFKRARALIEKTETEHRLHHLSRRSDE